MKNLRQSLIDHYPTLRGHHAQTDYGRAQVECLDTLYAALAPPWDGNHVPPAHRSLLPILAREVEGMAEPFFFAEDVIHSARLAWQDSESRRVALDTCRFPFRHFWFEWVEGGTLFGAHVRGSETKYEAALFTGTENFPFPNCVAVIRGNLRARGEEFSTLRLIDPPGLEEDPQTPVGPFLAHIPMLCAYLNIGTAVRTTQRKWDWEKQQLRARKGRPPLLSCNVVKMALPLPDRESEGTRVERGPGVRYHRRIGYLRISSHGDPEAYFVWVDEQWKGDWELGIVAHKSRDVTLSPRTWDHIAKYGERALRAIPPHLRPGTA